jgi:hypothetical protein
MLFVMVLMFFLFATKKKKKRPRWTKQYHSGYNRAVEHFQVGIKAFAVGVLFMGGIGVGVVAALYYLN